MKKSVIFIASVTAASATAISSSTSSSSSKVRISRHQDDSLKKKDGNSSKSVSAPASSDKFAPKFDGLRFIETLVTAHR